MKLLSDSEVAIVKTVVDRFLNLRESTPRKGLLLKFLGFELLMKTRELTATLANLITC